MKAIILAAGRGSRLRGHTDDRPKCLVEVAGRPLLAWQLAALREAGIAEVMVVRGYRGEMIQGDIATRDNRRWDRSNMVTSLQCAGDWLASGPCIVSYADIIYPAAAVTRLMGAEHPLSLLYDTNWLELWRQRFVDPMSDAESFVLDEQGFIRDIGRKNETMENVQGQYMGLLRFTPESAQWVCDLLGGDQQLTDSLDMTALLSRLIAAGKPVAGVAWRGKWCEVDSERDLQVAEALLAQEGFGHD